MSELVKREYLEDAIKAFIMQSEYYHPEEKCENMPIAEIKSMVRRIPTVAKEEVEKSLTVPYLWTLDYPDGDITVAYCKCSDRQLNRSWEFCPFCGRKIDWEEYDKVEGY